MEARPCTAPTVPESGSIFHSASSSLLSDPLLDCLEVISRHYERSIPREAFTAGLPLSAGRLTPRLFPRACARAGITAKIVRRHLNQLKAPLLPAVLLLKDNMAVLLLKLEEEKADIFVPGIGRGIVTIGTRSLEERYSGFTILTKPEFQLPDRPQSSLRQSSSEWFWDAIRPLSPTYAQILTSAAIVNFLGLAAPLFVMNVYDRVLPNKAFATLWVLAIGMTIAIIFDFLLRLLRNMLIGNAGRRADVLLANRIFEHILRIDFGSRPIKTGEFANQLRDFEFIREFFTSNTLVTLTDMAFIGLFIFIIYLIAGSVALVPLVALMLVIFIGFVMQFRIRNIVNEAQAEASHRHSILIEAITGLETIKSTRAEGQIQRQWEQFVGKNSKTAENLKFFSSIGLNLTTLIQQLVTVGVIVVGVYLFNEGEISPGALIAAVILSGRAVAPFGQIASTIGRSQQAFHSLQTLNGIMALSEETQQQTRYIDRPISKGEVTFQNVAFRYPESNKDAISDLTIHIGAGERVGIIGKIGSGKTTLGRLIARLYLPTSGTLLLDGVDICQYHPSAVRRCVSYVAQDAALFHGSVRDNIAFGSPHVSDERVLRAAQLAGVTDFVDCHPMGYNMPVGESGRLLSSGQRQAVTLARAFLFDPLIVFLDEPSGSMDMASERALVQRLSSAFGDDQTVILTTHRYNMLSLVDRLIVIDDGRVVADGPRASVLEALAGRSEQRK